MTHETLLTFALTTLLLPLAGFTAIIFLGRRLPRQGDWLGTGVLTVCLGLALTVMVTKLTAYPHETLTMNFPWVDFGNVPGIGPLTIAMGVSIDNLAAIMMVVVILISTLVHYFSVGYMHGDVRYSRYFAYLGFFTFSMMLIVLANSLFLLYVGWELVGISSYLLIGHWYEKKSASNAGMKAFIVNRVGDLGFLVGIMILFMTFNTFGLEEIFAAMRGGQIPFGSEGWLTAAGILIFCGAIGKSAQFPLHVWLPDAMEGPTPVSALIHAATMVAAGVYLVAQNVPDLHRRRAHGHRLCRRHHGLHLGDDRDRSERHQESAGLLHDLPARLYGDGAGRRGVDRRLLPPGHPRDVQGGALPRVGLGHPRDAQRPAPRPRPHHGSAGHPQYGRAEREDARHVLDVPDLHAGDLRRAAHLRVPEQGRNSRRDARIRRTHRAYGRPGRRVPGGGADGVLYVPAGHPDLPRDPREAGTPGAYPRIAEGHDRAARRSGGALLLLRLQPEPLLGCERMDRRGAGTARDVRPRRARRCRARRSSRKPCTTRTARR